jgi:ribosomal protein S18 acetylase RimI-like enzyme
MSLPLIRQIGEYSEVTDLESVKFIYQESFQPPFTVAMLEARLKRAERTWVYLINNEIVGYLMLDNDRGTPYLSQVATRISARRMGVATGLIAHAAQFLRDNGKSAWWLQTNFNNPAQKLYFDLGFRVSGFQEHLYGTDNHGIEMTQNLQ